MHQSTFDARPPRRAARLAVTAGLAAVLAAGGTLSPAPALAASAGTEAELQSLTDQVESAASTYADATAKADEIQGQVDALAREVLEVEQETLPAQRERAGEAAKNLYKNGNDAANTVSMLLSAHSLSDFIDLAKYLGVIQDRNTAELDRLNSLRDELKAKMAELSRSKDEAVKQEGIASEALASAKDAQAKIQQKADAEDAAEAEAARQAAEKAAAAQKAIEEAQQASKGATTGGQTAPSTDSGSTGTGGNQGSGSAGQTTPTAPDPEPSTPSTGGSTDASGWKSGLASYYGIGDGFMGGTTASGDIVTETSMGVAMLNVPLGTMVEITYNGKSVVCVVNDRGPYGGGRVIDLQPAPARALGFLSVGVDTVQYRFL